MLLYYSLWGQRGAGVPSDLQNQHGGLGASWVGSIPTCPRQFLISDIGTRLKDKSKTTLKNVVFLFIRWVLKFYFPLRCDKLRPKIKRVPLT